MLLQTLAITVRRSKLSLLLFLNESITRYRSKLLTKAEKSSAAINQVIFKMSYKALDIYML